MAEAKEKKDQLVFKGVSVKFSDELAKLFVKSGVGFYARPNTKGDKTLLCIMDPKDVDATLKNPDEDPNWVNVAKLNLNKSRKIKNKGEALMLGDQIKLLVAYNANADLDKGQLKSEDLAVKQLKPNEYLVCFESELEKFEKDPEKIPLTSAAPSKLFTVEEMVEEKLEQMKK